MLISFAVANFRSIKEKKEIRMLKTSAAGLPGNYTKGPDKKQVLFSAVVYGPNASGKSNFLRAIQAMEYLVKRSGSYKMDERISVYEPFVLEPAYASRPVLLEISFVAKDIQYDYAISYTSKRIETEELYYYPTKNRSLLYSRNANSDMKFGDYYKGIKRTIEKLLLPNQLFLSKASENNVDALKDPYFFFTKGLSAYPVIEPYLEHGMTNVYARRLAEKSQSAFSRRFNALICSLDTGISAVTVKKREWPEGGLHGLSDELQARLKEDNKYEVITQHPVFEGGKQVGVQTFNIEDESTGTRSLFSIGGLLLDALDKGRVLVVDEFEKNLHPGITKYFIQLFHNPGVNKKNAQLIFATHDVSQLSNDHFRRDQVWFTAKDNLGVTDLVNCADIPGLRLSTPIEKWYIGGRLGYTPHVDDQDFIIEMQKEDDL